MTRTLLFSVLLPFPAMETRPFIIFLFFTSSPFTSLEVRKTAARQSTTPAAATTVATAAAAARQGNGTNDATYGSTGTT